MKPHAHFKWKFVRDKYWLLSPRSSLAVGAFVMALTHIKIVFLHSWIKKLESCVHHWKCGIRDLQCFTVNFHFLNQNL